MEDNSSKVFKGMKSQTLITVIQGIMEMVNFSIMSRLLTQLDFGLCALLGAVTTVLASLTDAGIGSSIIQKKNPSESFVSTAYTLSIILGIIFGLLLFLGAPFFSDLMAGDGSLVSAFRLLSLILILQGYNNVFNAKLLRNLDFFTLGIYRSTAMFISYCIGIFLAYIGWGIYSVVVCTIFNHLIFTLIIRYVFRKESFKFGINKRHFKEILNFGGTLTITVIIRNITEQVDRLVVSHFISIKSLGELNRPSGFINTISSKINGIFDTILFPILSTVQDDKNKVETAFVNAISLVTVFSTFLAGTVMLGARYIIEIFFGDNWLNLTDLFYVLGFMLLFTGLNRIGDCFFRSLALMKGYFYIRLITCCLTIGLVILGCKWGIIGVAFAKLITEALSVIIKFVILNSYLKIDSKFILKPILNNCMSGLLLLGVIFSLLIIFPNLSYFVVFVYILLIFVISIYYPRFFGVIFEKYIYNKYLKFKKIKT